MIKKLKGNIFEKLSVICKFVKLKSIKCMKKHTKTYNFMSITFENVPKKSKH